jgi:hypothetical protein
MTMNSTGIPQRYGDDGDLPHGFDTDGSLAADLSFEEWQAELKAATFDEDWHAAREVDRIRAERTDWRM